MSTDQDGTAVTRVRSAVGIGCGVTAGFVLGVLVAIYIPNIIDYPGIDSWLAVKGIGLHLAVASGLLLAGALVKPAGGSSA